MRRHVFIALSVSVAASAHAQTSDPADGWETSLSADLTLVVSPDRDREDGIAPQSALYEMSLSGGVDRVLENGVEIGARGAFRAQKDNPTRAGFSGCVGNNFPGRIETGAFSGLNNTCNAEDIGPRGSIETAFIYLNGGYGEILAGRDLGVAARFQEGPDSVFSHARVTDPLLDLSGLGLARVRADLSGPAEKVTYTTPRLLGLRAGVSYTPRADVRGLDRDPARRMGGRDMARIENVWEAGLNGSRRLVQSGVRLRAGLGYASGEIDGPAGPLSYKDRVEVWSAGAQAEFEQVTVGASWLGSDNGVVNGDYEAWTAGASTRQYGLTWSLDYAQARDELIDAQSQAWGFGARSEIGNGLSLKAGLRSESLDRGRNRTKSNGFVLEITQSL